MTSSRRIALLLAIGLHLLLIWALHKQAMLRLTMQTVRHSLTVVLIPPEPPVPLAIPGVPAFRKNIPLSGVQKHSVEPAKSLVPQNSPTLLTPATDPSSVAPETKDAKDALTPRFNDPAALVKSYRYEDSKSDLQKAIESHGGTVALTKGQYDEFHQQMDFAGIPDCIGPDALKHDPPKVGPVYLSGLLVLPFLAHAALTGKYK